MNTNITVVKASHLQPFIHFLDERGLPVDDLLNKVHMEREQLSCADKLVPEAPFWEFLDLVVTEFGIPDIGFKVTEQLSLDSYGIFGANVLQSETLHKALITFISTMGKQSNCPPFWLVRGEQGIWFYRLGAKGINKGKWPVEQHVVSLMIQLVRSFTASDWTSSCVHLQTHTLSGAESTSSFANSQVLIDKPYTGICIPFDVLDNRPVLIDETEIINTDLTVNSVNVPTITRQIIKELIAQSSYTRSLSAEQIAQTLAISVRQMQRILKQEDTTFRSISDEVLVEEAKKMLSNFNASVVDIAVEFGYSEAANFTRAFKRLSGMSPSEYRQQM